MSKQSTEQLDSANRKVEAAQLELWRLSERANEINKKLLEHRAGVLSMSLRNLESKLSAGGDEPGYNAVLRSTQLSPTSSETSYSSSRTKFDGAHLFAGHENAVPPLSPRKPPSTAEYTFLEERLKDVTAKLQAANEAQSDARREVAMLKVELQGMETSFTLELQSAEEKVASMKSEAERAVMLERQLQELMAERGEWEMEREQKQREIEGLERRLEESQMRSREDDGTEQRVTELEMAMDNLNTMMHSHGLNLPDNSPITRRVSYLGTHLNDVQTRLAAYERQREEWEVVRHRLEEDVRVGFDKRELLSRELEDARKEREDYREKVHLLETRLRVRFVMNNVSMTVAELFPGTGDCQRGAHEGGLL